MSDQSKHPPAVARVVNSLLRAELAGVTAHTLAVALNRLDAAKLDYPAQRDQQLACHLLAQAGCPLTIKEFSIFLSAPQMLVTSLLPTDEMTEVQARNYVRWSAAFLNDPTPALATNARLLLRWAVERWREGIRAVPETLDPLRKVADDSLTGPKVSAYLVFALGLCGNMDDYDRVTQHAEKTIANDREHIDLVAEGLRYLYPPALINALQFFLDLNGTDPRSKQFMTGLHLLAKVAEVDDQQFWLTYADEMGALVDQLSGLASKNQALEVILDQIEKQLAYAAYAQQKDQDQQA
jgi:hypothetical protein